MHSFALIESQYIHAFHVFSMDFIYLNGVFVQYKYPVFFQSNWFEANVQIKTCIYKVCVVELLSNESVVVGIKIKQSLRISTITRAWTKCVVKCLQLYKKLA